LICLTLLLFTANGIVRRMTAAKDSQVYRDLLRFKPQDMTPNAWAVKAGVSRSVWADMRRHGNPSRKTLEKLLSVADSSLAEFEALRLGPVSKAAPGTGVRDARRGAWIPAALPPLPVFASALAGEWGDRAKQIEATQINPGIAIDRVSRPPSLASDPDAYVLTVVGDSMWPRFRPGRRIVVSPRSPVAIGDDVLVRVKPSDSHVHPGDGDLVLMKELVRRSNSFIELRQFNPDVNFQVDAGEFDVVERVVGELI